VNCGTWNALHRIEPQSCGFPVRLGEGYERFAPAFWVIPPRSYFAGSIGPNVKRTSELFYRFKTGEKALAFPLALGMFNALRDRGDIDFECIVPIPLSPAKAARGEIHRTRLLANELARLLGCPTREFLSLNRAISKGSMRGAGATRREFETAYYESLVVDDRIRAHKRVLIVDDVSTEGTTLRCACRKITDAHPDCALSASTAGQMVVKAVVLNAASVQV
jgi:predicted amidophosphoribosyltransferase